MDKKQEYKRKLEIATTSKGEENKDASETTAGRNKTTERNKMKQANKHIK
jgi:hypothetical protein